jgi:DNA mismatch endonuclease (patch repair protein)
MAEKLTVERRSWNMSRIRSRDTNPELAVRRALSRLGFRYRLHRRDLPGKPDIVLSKHRLAVFVHGCFWHQHKGCIDCSKPKTNTGYWAPKLLGNLRRDRKNRRTLRQSGWTPVVVWECETHNPDRLAKRLSKKLASHIDKPHTK